MGNSEFCLPSTLNVPRDEAKGKQNSLFSLGLVIKCLLMAPFLLSGMYCMYVSISTNKSYYYQNLNQSLQQVLVRLPSEIRYLLMV